MRTWKTALMLLVACSVLVVSGCGEDDSDYVPEGVDETNKPEQLLHIPLYPASPFHNPISQDAEIDPNSAAMVQSLVDGAREIETGLLIGVTEYTVPVYYADASTPRYDVELVADFAQDFGVKRLLSVPIPDWAAPDPADDGHMAIIDLDSRCEYDFWEAKKSNGQWQAGWANALPIDGDGIFPKGLSARGSGFALLNGLIWPDEIAAGKIDHALLFSYPFTKSGGPVPPATESDGWTDRPGAIPEGARLQLDPSLDLDALNLTPIERIVARALQEYGMICGDTNEGGILLYAIHPLSAKQNPYDNLPVQIEDGYIFLPNIPIDRFRVLRLPPQQDRTPSVAESDCAQFQ